MNVVLEKRRNKGVFVWGRQEEKDGPGIEIYLHDAECQVLEKKSDPERTAPVISASLDHEAP